MTNCIKVLGLCKSYGDFSLDHIRLEVPGGTIVGLIGENGAGKTTTIKCILNMVRPDAGEITLLGHDGREGERLAKQEIGVVLDECPYHDNLRPRDLERILPFVYENWDRELYRAYLKQFKLPEKKIIREFSRGMKMKLSLAAALAHRPRLLILDEATAGLDPVVREELLDQFRAFVCDEDHAILLSSHITSDLEKVCDYVCYIHAGRVELSGAKDDILDRYGRLVCTAAQLEGVDRQDLVRLRRGSYGCEALVSDRAAFARKYPQLTLERAGLEDIMIFIGKGEKA